MKILYKNKKIKVNYEIARIFEAGIILLGWEVKSMKERRFHADGAVVKVFDNEAFLSGVTIKQWSGSVWDKKTSDARDRKLLLKSNQIAYISEKSKQKGMAVVVKSIYINEKGLIKIEIALAKGLKKFDKRQKMKTRDVMRRVEQDRLSNKF